MKLHYFTLISQVAISMFVFSKIDLVFERTPDKEKLCKHCCLATLSLVILMTAISRCLTLLRVDSDLPNSHESFHPC